MISDTERREVAAKLSGEAQAWSDTFPDEVCDLGDVSALMQDLCHFAGLSGKVSCGDIFQRFADLIDRPKAKRETRQYDEYGPIWDYEGSEVKEIPLVDFGDRQEEASRYAESACAGL